MTTTSTPFPHFCCFRPLTFCEARNGLHLFKEGTFPRISSSEQQQFVHLFVHVSGFCQGFVQVSWTCPAQKSIPFCSILGKSRKTKREQVSENRLGLLGSIGLCLLLSREFRRSAQPHDEQKKKVRVGTNSKFGIRVALAILGTIREDVGGLTSRRVHACF